MAAGTIRIAMVSLHSSPLEAPGTGDAGGMNVAILATALELAQRGASVDLITRASGEPGSRPVAPGVTLHELAAGPAGRLPKEQLADVADEFGEAVAQLAGRKNTRFDLIHAHYWLSGLATLPVALELGLPLVQSFHTLGALKNETGSTEPERRVRTEMFLANQASAIVAGSAAEASALIDLARAPAEKIWVIPPGVDLDLFVPCPALDDLIAVVGRIQPLKDQELAIRTLGLLPAMRLAIVGEATPGAERYLEGLHRLVDELGLADRVRFTGALDRASLAGLLGAATVTLLPSQSETFGMIALESAAAGTPVVAYRGSGMVESVADGVSGTLVATRDPADWAAAVTSTVADRVRLGRRAREFAAGFTWATVATSLLGLYRSLAAGSSKPGRP